MKIRICSDCGKHNSATAWNCTNCGVTLSVDTIVEVNDELVELPTMVKDVQQQVPVSTETPAEQATPTNMDSQLSSAELFILYLVAKGIQDARNPTTDIAQALNISSSKALKIQGNLRKKIGGATNREMILLAKEKGYHLISQQPENSQLMDWDDQLGELDTFPNNDIRRQETISNRSRSLPVPPHDPDHPAVRRQRFGDRADTETNQGRLKKSEFTESSAEKMRGKIMEPQRKFRVTFSGKPSVPGVFKIISGEGGGELVLADDRLKFSFMLQGWTRFIGDLFGIVGALIRPIFGSLSGKSGLLEFKWEDIKEVRVIPPSTFYQIHRIAISGRNASDNLLYAFSVETAEWKELIDEIESYVADIGV